MKIFIFAILLQFALSQDLPTDPAKLARYVIHNSGNWAQNFDKIFVRKALLGTHFLSKKHQIFLLGFSFSDLKIVNNISLG